MVACCTDARVRNSLQSGESTEISGTGVTANFEFKVVAVKKLVVERPIKLVVSHLRE